MLTDYQTDSRHVQTADCQPSLRSPGSGPKAARMRPNAALNSASGAPAFCPNQHHGTGSNGDLPQTNAERAPVFTCS